MVLVALATLLMTALLIMFFFSRKAVKEEALQKAGQTLESTVQNIDNILLSVEQSAGNIYWKMMSHIDQPDMMDVYSRKLVESNSYIVGCAIAFEPYFYKDRGQNFMSYYHRSGLGKDGTVNNAPIVKSASFGNHPYTEQEWYTNAIEKGLPYWTDPIEKNETMDEAITSFCLPIYGREKKVGVLAVDVSLTLLSEIVLKTKPSPNSFCTLLGRNGSFIVHPDTSKLNSQTIFTLIKEDGDSSVKEAAKAMMSGEAGYKHVQLHGKDYYVFYKPFVRSNVPGRSMEKLEWSAGIIYPENDIFGDYNRLLYLVLVIAVIGLLLLLLLCQAFIHRQFLPLRLLSKSAQRIAEGYYDEPIPDSRQKDEVGRLQNHFQQMQHSLATHVGEMKRLSDDLQKRGEVLQAAYEQAQGADRMKTNFLYNMSNQMTSLVSGICSSVTTISHHYNDLTEEKTNSLVDDIQQRGEKITALLNQLIADSEKMK